MKKSIITMVAIVIVAAINLNVYLDDAEALGPVRYEASSTRCYVKMYDRITDEYLGTAYNCALWNELTGSINDPFGGSTGGSTGGSEDSSEDDGYSSEDWSCEIATGEFDCWDANGNSVDCDGGQWVEMEQIIVDGTETFCHSLGMESSCEETDGCEE